MTIKEKLSPELEFQIERLVEKIDVVSVESLEKPREYQMLAEGMSSSVKNL